MELSELTNRELKNILRENQVKNYSKLNKKELVKKVNQLTREQNGGKSGKRKYKLKELIGGQPEKESLLSNENRKRINNQNSNSGKNRGYIPPSIVNSGKQNPKNQVSPPNSSIQPNTNQNQVSPANLSIQPNTNQNQVSPANTLNQSEINSQGQNESKCNSCSIQ